MQASLRPPVMFLLAIFASPDCFQRSRWGSASHRARDSWSLWRPWDMATEFRAGQQLQGVIGGPPCGGAMPIRPLCPVNVDLSFKSEVREMDQGNLEPQSSHFRPAGQLWGASCGFVLWVRGGISLPGDEVRRRCRTVLQSKAETFPRDSRPDSQHLGNAHPTWSWFSRDSENERFGR